VVISREHVRMGAEPTNTKSLNTLRAGRSVLFGWNRWFPYWCGNKTTVVWNVYFGINSLSKATIFHVSGMSFQIDKRMLQGREQLDFSRAAADPAIYQSINRISTMVIPRARLLPESFLLGVITIPRAHGLPGVKLLEPNTFLEAFLPGNLLLLGAYGFLESTHPSQKKKADHSKMT
jgi:hypothetical protein